MKWLKEGNWISGIVEPIKSQRFLKITTHFESLFQKTSNSESVRNMHLEEASFYLKIEVLFLLCSNCTRNNSRIFKRAIICFSGSLFSISFELFRPLARRSHSAPQALTKKSEMSAKDMGLSMQNQNLFVYIQMDWFGSRN